MFTLSIKASLFPHVLCNYLITSETPQSLFSFVSRNKIFSEWGQPVWRFRGVFNITFGKAYFSFYFNKYIFVMCKIHTSQGFRQTSDRIATPTDDGHLSYTVTLRVAKTICMAWILLYVWRVTRVWNGIKIPFAIPSSQENTSLLFIVNVHWKREVESMGPAHHHEFENEGTMHPGERPQIDSHFFQSAKRSA